MTESRDTFRSPVTSELMRQPPVEEQIAAPDVSDTTLLTFSALKT